MTDSHLQQTQIQQLEKLHAAWLPMVVFLFGDLAPDTQFDGFEISNEIATPQLKFPHENSPYHYIITMPSRSFTNEVMLLADLVQVMVQSLYPVGFTNSEREQKTTALCEGAAIYGAVAAIRQVFGEETVDSYLNALHEQAFAYYDAFSYTAVLLADDPQAVKKLRNVKPFLFDISKADFDVANVKADRKVKDVLLFTFRN